MLYIKQFGQSSEGVMHEYEVSKNKLLDVETPPM